MNDFGTGARELDDDELAAVNGGMWANYDWRDAVIDALP
ncbi:bacteriocin [Nonomuraea spiralis]|uniref:Bacteriocin n=1 Tax=Nonomuraea spiralis TaxID=46182 RepID=A0ABV5IXF7_9ACTN|nr:bacteriocin [Nonomuraea spiralis]